jgi:hypothetical protein
MAFPDEPSNFHQLLCCIAGAQWRSSPTNTRPALERQRYPSHTAVRLRERLAKSSRFLSSVSVADLPNFKQNLMQTSCSILPSTAENAKHEAGKTLT